MATIDQVIDIIPDAGHRGVDARTLFVTKQEAFQDAITDAFVPQLNTFKTEANLLASEVNTLRNGTLALRNETENIRNLANTQTQAQVALATTQAGIATTKASEANSSANQALTYKNQVMGYVIPAGTSYSADQINTQNSAMTKAQFNALAEERKANRAGSGFDTFGKGSSTTSLNVNEGIWTDNTQSNKFYIGKTTANSGTSITNHAESMVNGILQKLKYLNSASLALAEILLPTAPNIYPHDAVLTAEQIASGVIKHADASNSGLIVNGKFGVDTSGWVANSGATIIQESGKLKLSQTTTDYATCYQAISCVIGKTYIVEALNTTGSTAGFIQVRALTSSGNISSIAGYGTFVATQTTHYICPIISSAIDNSYTYFDNIAVYPADAISRSDLCLLESWHEDVSEKNFVYPLGNVQYLGANTDGLTGIANGAFTGFETYSLFGNFQASSALIGRGYIWSSLTEAQKKAFIANPENNCYLDGDKAIQVRYRVRVLIGEDTNSMSKATVQGKAVVPSTVLFTAPVTTVDAGLYSNTSATYTYTGTSTNAISIANVSRKNQGMSHPVYNPNGSKKASDNNFWYNTAVSFTSISDCFDPAKLLTASGYIGTVSGRPDGLFYDQIHEGDITDLRNSSKKVEDYNRLISREFNKLVAGTNRGKEGEWEIKYYFNLNITAIAASVWQGFTSYKFATNPPVEYRFGTYSGINHNYKAYYINGSSVTEIYAIQPDGYFFIGNPTVSSGYVVIARQTTRTKSNTLLHCDIIGNPVNYPTAWKESGVFGTPLIVAEDGTSLLPDGTLDTFKLSRKANATPLLCLRSTDSGATWTSFTPTFNTITNEITLTNEPATNLVMVYYQTHTSMAVPVTNSEVIEIGEVLGTDGIGNGHLISTLIGKVPTANTAPYLQMGYDINGYRIDMSTFKFSTTTTEIPLHSALSLAGGAVGVPVVKVFPYLTRTNGKAYLNLVFKEMKHNGTSWGDSNTFNIVDNVSITTDNNAQTVLIGQKTVELNVFIEAGE